MNIWTSSVVTFKAHPFGATILLLAALGALAAPSLSPFDPTALVALPNQPISGTHWLGTDSLGRSVLARILYSLRPALLVALVTPLLATLVGVSIGVVAGMSGRRIDALLMRFIDGLYALPGLLVALMIVAALGPSLWTVILALSISRVAVFARIARVQVDVVANSDYVDASRLAGAGPLVIIATHVLPNISSPIIVEAFIAASTALTTEAALSFLGLGIPPPMPTWGMMLREGLPMIQYAPLPVAAAGVAILVGVLAINAVEDLVRRVLP
jgi:ABC-type dipeptide/oligopeptide/nickel transport system permease subunit